MVAAIHEALHALAMLKWGKIPRSDVVFGYNWKAFMPYFGSSTFSVVLAQYPLLRRRNLSTYFERYYRNV